MCGIHGFVSSKLKGEDAQKIIGEMINATLHRGPDYSGHLLCNSASFGHNRLSIIDLNDEANQPMICDDLVIVFNGEIYNFKEIRTDLMKRGIAFKTLSDTEVILKAFQCFGPDCVKMFVGMWAFAIYDKKKEELFCSRDRFGIKPFYYILKDGELFFASEIKSLKKTPAFRTELNLKQVSKGLQLGWVTFESETYFSGIQQLEPGTNAVFSSDKTWKVEKYWEIKPSVQPPLNDKDAIAYFKHLFDDSMRLHLRSDVPVGATLSGGLDSSSIVCSILMNDTTKNLNTFSIYYQGENTVDERPFVKKIQEKYPEKFNSFYFSPTQQQIQEDFEKITDFADFPLSGSSPISQYYVMDLAKKHGIKVVLSGQGADDFMGGYMHSYYRLLADDIRNFKFNSFFKEFNLFKSHQNLSYKKSGNVLLKTFLSVFLSEQRLYNLEYKNYFPFLVDLAETTKQFELNSQGNSNLDHFHSVLMNYSSLPTLLHYEDRNSMAHSIESRVPFLDHRIVEFMFQQGNNLKIRNGYTKWILREAMQDRLPSEIKFRKDKKGFVTPGEIVWLRGPLKHLLEIDYNNIPFIDKKKAENLIRDFKKGNNQNANLVWRLVNLVSWLNKN